MTRVNTDSMTNCFISILKMSVYRSVKLKIQVVSKKSLVIVLAIIITEVLNQIEVLAQVILDC